MTAISADHTDSISLLGNVDWATYTRFLKVFGKQRFRHTYDRGRLEIMSPISFEHDNLAYLLGRFVDELVEQLNLDYAPGRCVTLRKRKKQRGLEPDNCYWIASGKRMHGKKGPIDFQIDPPPDLAIEVEISRSALRRMKIYASLSVPEVWRTDGSSVRFAVLRGGKYRVEAKSTAFPNLGSSELNVFLTLIGAMGVQPIVKQFRQWLQQQLPSWQTQENPPS